MPGAVSVSAHVVSLEVDWSLSRSITVQDWSAVPSASFFLVSFHSEPGKGVCFVSSSATLVQDTVPVILALGMAPVELLLNGTSKLLFVVST